MILGYIRISTIKQELENQKNVLYEFARSKKFIIDQFIEVESSSRKENAERGIDKIFDILKKDDVLIVTELSRLGRSSSAVLSIVNKLIKAGIKLLTVKENIDLHNKHSMQSKVMISMFALFAELERDLISQRTKEALMCKKAQGVKLGRPKGPGKSKLEKHKPQIQEFLDKKVSMLSIAKILGVSYPTLFNFIKIRDMKGKVAKNPSKDQQFTIRVKLILRIENNTKFVRGVKKTIQTIELGLLRDVGSYYRSLGGNEYLLEVKYKNQKDLDALMEGLLHDISSTANRNYCRSEGTYIQSMDEEDKCWEI